MNRRKGNTKRVSWKRRNVLVFDFAGKKCAIPSRKVGEVILLPQLTKGPGLPSIIEGVMNLGGEAVPVLRLDRLFGLAEANPGLYTPLIVLKGSETPLALLVDRVWQVKSIGADAVMPFDDAEAFNGCIEAELSIDGETVHLLSVERVLLEREQKSVTEFQAMEQKRLGEAANGKAPG